MSAIVLLFLLFKEFTTVEEVDIVTPEIIIPRGSDEEVTTPYDASTGFEVATNTFQIARNEFTREAVNVTDSLEIAQNGFSPQNANDPSIDVDEVDYELVTSGVVFNPVAAPAIEPLPARIYFYLRDAGQVVGRFFCRMARRDSFDFSNEAPHPLPNPSGKESDIEHLTALPFTELQKIELHTLPVVLDSNRAECSICFRSYSNENDQGQVLKWKHCGEGIDHLFCRVCVWTWLQKCEGPTCPLCRSTVVLQV